MDVDLYDSNKRSIKYFHYNILEYSDKSFYHEISVLECGGYYVAMCIFKNKINICVKVFYNKRYSNVEDCAIKIHCSTAIYNE